MIKRFLFLASAVAMILTISSCEKPVVCTQELRMITIKVEDHQKIPVTLDEAYTIRKSTGEKITYQQNMQNFYIVLDDIYQPKLQNQTDDFQFIGMKANQKVVDETFRIKADKCHIYKISGKDSVIVQ